MFYDFKNYVLYSFLSFDISVVTIYTIITTSTYTDDVDKRKYYQGELVYDSTQKSNKWYVVKKLRLRTYIPFYPLSIIKYILFSFTNFLGLKCFAMIITVKLV